MIKKKRQNSKTKKMLRIKKTFLVGGGGQRGISIK